MQESQTVMDPRRDVIVTLTRSHTLYASVPRGNGRYATRRCRVAGRPGQMEANFEGSLLSVQLVKTPLQAGVDVVRCGELLFALVAGSYGRPIVGERMAVGGDSRGVQEVSSRVDWMGVMDIDRAWAIEPMFRAFRNGARDWRSFMTEQPHEQGDEHIEDESGGLRAGAFQRHYRDYLLEHARERDEHLTRMGHEVMPTHRVISNEDLAAKGEELAAELAGSGMAQLRQPRERHRTAIASSFERCWGAVRRMDDDLAPEAKAA